MTATFQTTVEGAKSFAAKTLFELSEAAQAYPQVADFISTAKDFYAKRPSVDEAFDQTITAITQTAPWMVSKVSSHMDSIPNKSALTEVDKVALLVVLAISALAAVMVGLWLLKKFFSCLLGCVMGSRGESESVQNDMAAQKSPKATRKSASPKRASRKPVDAETEETQEAAVETVEEIAPKSVSRRLSTKTPRLRTPSRTEATIIAEAATVESATPAPAKVLDFGVTPKKGATPAVVDEKTVKAEEATPRRSARLQAMKENVAPMPAVEETEPVSLPAENPAVEWDKLTIPDLKAELRRRGEKVGGNKAELVERLQNLGLAA
jgi:hypothetical protein